MLTTNTTLRAAAVAGVTAIITAGAIGPAVACDHSGGHRGTQASSRHVAHAQAAGHERSSDQGTEARHSDRSTRGGDRARQSSAGQERGSDQGTETRHSDRGTRGGDRARQSSERGHQPVTVCHLLGNGGYHLLTFDKHALKAHLHHGDLYPVPADGCPTTADQGRSDQGKGHEHGHARVTVCHLLGNGGYHLLTFDQHALKAHLHHGDLYPVPAAGCPTPDTGTTPGGTTPGGTGTTPGAPGGTTTVPGGTTVTPPAVQGSVSGSTPGAEVLGVQEVRPGAASSSPTVLGTEAVRGTGTAPTAARVAPSTGILPQTGAGALTLPLVGGFGLVAAGTALLARRRTRTDG